MDEMEEMLRLVADIALNPELQPSGESWESRRGVTSEAQDELIIYSAVQYSLYETARFDETNKAVPVKEKNIWH